MRVPQPQPLLHQSLHEDLAKLPAGQLKEMIQQAGLSVAGCVEKGDLVERLLSGPSHLVTKAVASVRGKAPTPGSTDLEAQVPSDGTLRIRRPRKKLRIDDDEDDDVVL